MRLPALQIVSHGFPLRGHQGVKITLFPNDSGLPRRHGGCTISGRSLFYGGILMGISKRRSGAWMWLLLVASAVSFTGMTAAAQTYRNGIGVTVYTNPNFNGQRSTFNNHTPSLGHDGLDYNITK